MEVLEPSGVTVLVFECFADHVYMLVKAVPELSPSEIMRTIKSTTSPKLREEFPQLSAMPNIWTRNYFVSTESEFSEETIDWYVNTQKTRP